MLIILQLIIAFAMTCRDADAGLYDCLHLNFTSQIPRPLLDSLAEGRFCV